MFPRYECGCLSYSTWNCGFFDSHKIRGSCNQAQTEKKKRPLLSTRFREKSESPDLLPDTLSTSPQDPFNAAEAQSLFVTIIVSSTQYVVFLVWGQELRGYFSHGGNFVH